MARAAIALFLLIWAGAAFAEDTKNRVALVIGNSAYKRSALSNPVNDARLMAEKLKAQGFEVFAYYDTGQRDMKRAVQSFAATLRLHGKDAAAFIFYAGHGVQVKGENYLIPVDEHIENEGDVDIDAVSVSSIMSMLENSETRLAIVVLDACRNNPFGYARGGERGLARVDAPSGSLIAFSTSPGRVAKDGPADGNSYYTAALAQAMEEPGLKIEEVFKKVRIAVREKTHSEQTPWESTSLTGDFYPAGEKVAAPAATAPTEPPPAKPQQVTSAKPETKPVPATAQYEDAAQRLVRIFSGHRGAVLSVAISPNGRTALSGGYDFTVKLWNVSTGSELKSFSGHTKVVNSVVFSPDGGLALSAGETLRLWDIPAGRLSRSFEAPELGSNAVAFSPNGQIVISGGSHAELTLWHIPTGPTVKFRVPHTIQSVAFSPDSRLVLVGGVYMLELLDATTGQKIRDFASEVFESVTISPDGRTALSGSSDPFAKGSQLKLWDIAAGRELRSFNGHKGDVYSAAISPDGRFALSGGQDRTLKLWDMASGRELRSFTGHTSAVRSVAISPDGRTALSGSTDATLRLWDLSEWTQPQEARR